MNSVTFDLDILHTLNHIQVNLISHSSRLHEEYVAKVVGATSSEGY